MWRQTLIDNGHTNGRPAIGSEKQVKRAGNMADDIACVLVEDGPMADNLIIAMCTYFEGHPERPVDDEPQGEECWGPWALAKANECIRRVATQAAAWMEQKDDDE